MARVHEQHAYAMLCSFVGRLYPSEDFDKRHAFKKYALVPDAATHRSHPGMVLRAAAKEEYMKHCSQ